MASCTCSCVALSNSWLGCCAYLLTPPSAGSACINFNSCVSVINSAARSRRTVSMYSLFNRSTGTSRLSDNRTFTASSSAFGISGFVALFKSFNNSVLEFTLFSNSVYRGSDASFFNSFMIVSFAFCGKSSSAFRKLSFGASSSYLNWVLASFSSAFSSNLGFSPSTKSVFMRSFGWNSFISPVRVVSPSLW